MPVIGFLNGGSPAGYAPMVASFHQGLKETGYVEAQNVTIEYRWAGMACTIGCQQWWLTWFVVRWPS